MIAHDASGGSRIDHSPHEIDGGHLLRPAIDQITEKDCPATRMAPGPCAFAIAQVFQQRGQPVELAMYVADHVNAVGHVSLIAMTMTLTAANLTGRRDSSPRGVMVEIVSQAGEQRAYEATVAASHHCSLASPASESFNGTAQEVAK